MSHVSHKSSSKCAEATKLQRQTCCATSNQETSYTLLKLRIFMLNHSALPFWSYTSSCWIIQLLGNCQKRPLEHVHPSLRQGFGLTWAHLAVQLLCWPVRCFERLPVSRWLMFLDFAACDLAYRWQKNAWRMGWLEDSYKHDGSEDELSDESPLLAVRWDLCVGLQQATFLPQLARLGGFPLCFLLNRLMFWCVLLWLVSFVFCFLALHCKWPTYRHGLFCNEKLHRKNNTTPQHHKAPRMPKIRVAVAFLRRFNAPKAKHDIDDNSTNRFCQKQTLTQSSQCDLQQEIANTIRLRTPRATPNTHRGNCAAKLAHGTAIATTPDVPK